MDSFRGRIAVVTGGGDGMGRQLVRQLAAEGCHVAMCDVSADAMRETAAGCAPGTRITAHEVDVSDEAQVERFRDEVAEQHRTDRVHLVLNNAGIGGGGSLVADPRADWDRVFAVCWNGVYYSTRAFLPMLMAADEGHLVNVSSVNAIWAHGDPVHPTTAYSAAKMAVRGLTEALQTDFRVNAPHLRASVVFPGHIGTSILLNSQRVLGRDPDALDGDFVAGLRGQLERSGRDLSAVTDDELRARFRARGETFRDRARTTAEDAARTILDGVRHGEWRILIGPDAVTIDELVRADPQHAYDPEFRDRAYRTGLFGTSLR